tara:strand:+ start:3251 stop:3916 length:666 start_codon:yes stop_codon:yes gene_type:complete
MPKSRRTRDRTRNRGKRKAGTRDSFLSTKVSVRQLSQVGLSRDETDKIFRELAAIKIQDQFKKMNLAKCKKLLNVITNHELEMFLTVFEHFIDSVNTTYEFDDRKTPGYLLNVKPMAETAIRQAKMLLGLKRNPEALKTMFNRVGYNNLAITIVTSINNIRNTIVAIQGFRNIAVDDYRGAQLGIEPQPSVRNRTTRRVDSVIRPPRTTRAQAMTRRVRSR